MCAETLLYLMSVLTANLSKIKGQSPPRQNNNGPELLGPRTYLVGLVGWLWPMDPSQYAQGGGAWPSGEDTRCHINRNVVEGVPTHCHCLHHCWGGGTAILSTKMGHINHGSSSGNSINSPCLAWRRLAAKAVPIHLGEASTI